MCVPKKQKHVPSSILDNYSETKAARALVISLDKSFSGFAFILFLCLNVYSVSISVFSSVMELLKCFQWPWSVLSDRQIQIEGIWIKTTTVREKYQPVCLSVCRRPSFCLQMSRIWFTRLHVQNKFRQYISIHMSVWLTVSLVPHLLFLLSLMQKYNRILSLIKPYLIIVVSAARQLFVCTCLT